MQKDTQILIATAVASVGILAVASCFGGREQNAGSGRIRRLANALFAKAGGKGGASLHGLPHVAAPELREVGAESLGERQYANKRLYMQLRVLEVDLSKISISHFSAKLAALMSPENSFVMYRDAVTSNGLGLLTWSADPAFFVTTLNDWLAAMQGLFVERVGWTMFGKTYSNGHEKDLEEFLFKKPIRNAQNEKWDWAIWYPLKRRGPFYTQPPEDQCRMLLAHAGIGKAFADVGAAHDIRLKCFGMDPLDNEYVIGLCGEDVHGLSRVVEEMRKTRHTAEFLERLGPFFVGQKIPKM